MRFAGRPTTFSFGNSFRIKERPLKARRVFQQFFRGPRRRI